LSRRAGRGLEFPAMPYMILLVFFLVIGLVATCALM